MLEGGLHHSLGLIFKGGLVGDYSHITDTFRVIFGFFAVFCRWPMRSFSHFWGGYVKNDHF
jgi:hypothetical protein